LRLPTEVGVWAAHLVVVEGETVGDLQFETDRAGFVGSGRGIRTPISVIDGQSLSNTAGTVLDPIFSLRSRVRIARGATARLAFWTLIAASRAEVLDLADKHRDPAAFDRAVTLAWTQAQVQLYHLGVAAAEADLFQPIPHSAGLNDPKKV
jgi:cyclic beta-1,2-glucan synthetase